MNTQDLHNLNTVLSTLSEQTQQLLICSNESIAEINRQNKTAVSAWFEMLSDHCEDSAKALNDIIQNNDITVSGVSEAYNNNACGNNEFNVIVKIGNTVIITIKYTETRDCDCWELQDVSVNVEMLEHTNIKKGVQNFLDGAIDDIANEIYFDHSNCVLDTPIKTANTDIKQIEKLARFLKENNFF